MALSLKQIAGMLDLSSVKADSTEDDVRAMAELACKYDCIACFAMPSYTAMLVELLKGNPKVNVGGVAGFPSGAVTTAAKAAQAKEMIGLGCSEIDMVINIGRLKSGDESYVLEDIQAVAAACGDVPLKVILECHYLTDDEIKTGCRLCIEGGASFVKTGTGWAETGASAENIALIKDCVGDRIKIKAAGGVGDIDTLLRLYELGAERFGVSSRSGTVILTQAEQQGL